MSDNKIKTKSDKLLLEEAVTVVADEVMEAIATSIPGINIAYKLAKAYDGRAMKLRQYRSLEFVEFIRNNLGSFSKQICKQEEFHDCFAQLIYSYIRERSEKKRSYYQKLLIGLTNKNEQELKEFELERMILVTTQISPSALSVLYFIKSNFIEQIEKDIQKQLEVYKEDKESVESIRLEDRIRAGILISDYISHWIYENYNVNSEIVKEKYNFPVTSRPEVWHEVSYAEHLKEKELTDPLPELANLGILIRKNGSEVVGGNIGSGYSLSNFGYKYLEYLDEKSQ